MHTAFDTLSAARRREASGIQPEQAEAIVQAVRSSREAPCPASTWIPPWPP